MAVVSRRNYAFPLRRELAVLQAQRRQPKAVPSTTPQLLTHKKPQLPDETKPNDLSIPYDPKSKREVVGVLIDLCTAFISAVWPAKPYRMQLRAFIYELLRRSKVPYAVFQVALCYLLRLQPVVAKARAANTLPPQLACGRRVLVAALQVATKFVNDRCYSAKVWVRISGLSVKELTANELELMKALDWRMSVPYEAYMRLCRRLRVSASTALQHTKDTAVREESDVVPTPNATPISSPRPQAVITHSPDIEIWNTPF